ncbi:hypothetical protein HHK36_027432 [Tetracentron sinense]|uniref:Mitochondrial import inner membrane translocase subunit TIM23 n=1 Tax=Tetracentron sinense TaxID=13715 RepID=A0A834YHN3_TETSI|nr:hypothetical protein HHK36_027432 [Tetracentron sinense]
MADSRTGRDDDDHPRLYNPYQDLQLPIQNLYKIPTSPEFLFQEESIAQRRSWGENLTYYTGCGYLSGAIAGAGKGFFDGVKASEEGDTLKLRVNRILNASGHSGRKFGNRVGVIGLLYAGLESGIVAVRDTDDVMNSVLAGLGTGALFKAASGPRSAAVAGAIGGLMVGAAVAAKQLKFHIVIYPPHVLRVESGKQKFNFVFFNTSALMLCWMLMITQLGCLPCGDISSCAMATVTVEELTVVSSNEFFTQEILHY